jgi:GNAT superfamily N-acetyltransferase
VKGSESDGPAGVLLRTDLRPGDLGSIIHLHGIVYARERGFDVTFESYVAGPLSEFVRSRTDRQRLWIAEEGGRIVGSIGVVSVSAETAQLRWFLVDPACRGKGVGRRLVESAVAFSDDCGYAEIVLWTESALEAAARLYRAAGFRKVEEKPGRMWGVDLVEEKYALRRCRG